MKEFFRSFLGSCLGVMVAFLLVILLIFGLGAVFSEGSTGTSKELKDDSILKLDFKNPIPEKSDNIQTSFGSGGGSAIGLRELTKLIKHAEKDSKIKGILLNASDISMGQSTLMEIRNTLEEFKKSKKFVYAYADYYSQGSYILSSVADSVFLNPNGAVDLHGMAVTSPFFKGMLDKIGVDFEVFYAGNFKSATEPFRRTEMSPENRLQTKEFLNGMFDIFKDKVAKSRKIPMTNLDLIITNLEGRTAQKALDNKLVDRLIYWDQFEGLLKKRIGNDDDDPTYISIEKFDEASTIIEKGSSSKKIALLFAEGDVAYGSNGRGNINDIKYLKVLDDIKENDDIKALVLRVNSGGGSALTSDLIWREIEEIKKKGIPVVASFGDYAASGGYYIAAGADYIYSSPNTLTGSIGVFSMIPNVNKLATQKLGITFDSVSTHPHAISASSVFALNDFDRKIMTESTNQIYDLFLGRVAKGRKMDVKAVNEIAQGRVWTGIKGKEIGLVDAIGSLDDAINYAAKLAKIDSDYKVSEYPKFKETVYSKIISDIMKMETDEDDNESQLLQYKMTNEQKLMLDIYTKYKIVFETEGVQAKTLYRLNF
jgi:protease IV